MPQNEGGEPEIRMVGKGWKFSSIAATVGLILTLGGLVVVGANDRSTAFGMLNSDHSSIIDHESRMRAIEKMQESIASDQKVTAGDVRWIREALNKQGVRP